MPEEEEKKEEEEEVPAWLAETLIEAAEKRETDPSMVPPPVSQRENDYMNISEDDREKKFKRTNNLIIALVVIQLIALGFVIWWP